MSDSAADPQPSENLQPRGIEHDLDIIDSALVALDSDDLEAAEALAAGLGGTPAQSGASAEPGADGGGSEQTSADRPG